MQKIYDEVRNETLHRQVVRSSYHNCRELNALSLLLLPINILIQQNLKYEFQTILCFSPALPRP